REDFEDADLADHALQRGLRRVEVVHVGRVLVGDRPAEALWAVTAADAAAALVGGLGRLGGLALQAEPLQARALCRRPLGARRRALRPARGGAPSALRLGVGLEDLV